ncbi:MAG: phosphate ABC transporter permease PstA [Candidatus Eisenbacteria bacterium]|nr:phosphate ABC transporter permease PstA [Candidatus Eisenbacteria bacterium]
MGAREPAARSDARHLRRRALNVVMTAVSFLCVLLALIPLVSVFAYILGQGAQAINLDFFLHLPKPVGEAGGGMANAIVGTLELVALACLVGLPFGILGGIFLAEYADSPLARTVRFTADVLSGVPSIVVGVFVFAMVVRPMKSFSAIAGGVALAILMIPTVMRTTEELMRLVPGSLREAALALGVPKWRTILLVVLQNARGGIVMGIMLAIARIAGETAPLLFTALGNRFWSVTLHEPIASLPVQIFTYAISPYEDWHRQAWAGALVLVFMVLVLNVIARTAIRARAGSAR